MIESLKESQKFHYNSKKYRGYHAVIYKLQDKRGSIVPRAERENIFSEMKSKGLLEKRVDVDSLKSVNKNYSKIKSKKVVSTPDWYSDWEKQLIKNSEKAKAENNMMSQSEFEAFKKEWNLFGFGGRK